MKSGVVCYVAEGGVVQGEVFSVFCYLCFFDFEHEEDGAADYEGYDVAEADGDCAAPVRAEGVAFFRVSKIEI